MAKVGLGGWDEHWLRVGRWHERLEEICQEGIAASGVGRGLSPVGEIARAQDDVLAFFVFCYHLSDAVLREGWQTKAQIRAYIKGNAALALCRDLATDVKHFEVDSPYLKTSFITTSAEPVVVMSGMKRPCEPTPGMQWIVETAAGKKDVFELADECIVAWQGYLTSLKL